MGGGRQRQKLLHRQIARPGDQRVATDQPEGQLDLQGRAGLLQPEQRQGVEAGDGAAKAGRGDDDMRASGKI